MTRRARLLAVVLVTLGGLVVAVAAVRRQRLEAATVDFERRYGPA